MPPGGWTALFFLDEATALAAGHRPCAYCAYCRRSDFLYFAEGWRRAHRLVERPRAVFIDAQLDTERVDSRTRWQLTRQELVGGLPDGVIVWYRGVTGLLLDEHVLPWSFGGTGLRSRSRPLQRSSCLHSRRRLRRSPAVTVLCSIRAPQAREAQRAHLDGSRRRPRH